ncbi:membrane protein [Streptomyces eurocidicus]|uniref:Membrane protein n=1 Tax=Streptomyces eurocidicus TaxID=66423 RepID=A0A2N8NXH1_STREU|nr:tight adherence protein B [Streptomyces eurocidicus]PNE33456.1 membrane protein [Streptomyces eurocidicus]
MTGAGAVPQTALVCAVALGAVAWSLSRPGQEVRRARLLFAGGGDVGPPGLRVPPWVGGWGARLRRSARERRELACLPVGCALALWGESVLPLLFAAVAVPLVRRRLAARAAGRERERRETAVIELCGEVAGELRAGRQPHEALAGASAGTLGGGWAAVPAAARFGGDVPAALRSVGRRPGAEGLNGVAACWQVAVDGGAGLAAGLDKVAGALSAERDQREELRAQLAGTRSTAAMLAVLPVLALLMGGALGAEPLRVLLHTVPGLACLALGGLLEWAGLMWTKRIVRTAGGGEA